VIPITRPELPPLHEYTALLEEIWGSRMLSNFGPMAQRLESLTSDYLGVTTRVIVSGDIGLTLTIAAMDLPRGSACLVPSFTFNSTINAVLWNGLRPVFVDIDPEAFTLDPADARSAASEAGDVRLIIATHVFGNPADADGLRAVADDYGARLLFDAAHGYGASRDGVMVGGLGDAEVFSLSGTKPVTTAEGGLIATEDPALLERIKLLRGYGFFGDYMSKLVGLNGKMSELHAALGLLTMRRVDEALAIREGHIAAYRTVLDAVPGIGYQRVRPQDRSTYKDFALVFADRACRDKVEAVLTAEAIQTKRYFKPCHTMDAFASLSTRPLPVTEAMHDRILCIPLFESLAREDVERIAGLIRDAV
jgi:dTDP-4-amino-4,6-dideoxygalactose transaminase